MKLNSDLLVVENAYNTSKNTSYSCDILNGEVLYDGGATAGIVTLSKPWEENGFKHIKIEYTLNTNATGIQSIILDTARAYLWRIFLFAAASIATHDGMYLAGTRYYLRAQSIEPIVDVGTSAGYSYRCTIKTTGEVSCSRLQTSAITIVRVIGYKY